MNYKHDCDACKYLGSVEDLIYNEVTKLDIYWCIHPSFRGLDSVIARFGSEGSKYLCSHPPSENNKNKSIWYQFALQRAEELGIYKKENQ
jgi:hypothetical protein